MKIVTLLSLGVVAAAPAVRGTEGAEQAPLRSGSEVIAQAPADAWRDALPENVLYVELEAGRVIVELAPAYAPLHVEQMKTLARAKFYDGLTFYRVVENFVAQGGAGDTERDVGPGRETLPAEFERAIDPALPFTPLGAVDGYASEVGFSDGFPAARDPESGSTWLVHCPRAMAMARDTLPDTGGTEIYVVIGHAPRYLDRNLTIFGRVLQGQHLLQMLHRGEGPRGMIENEADHATILSIRVASDLPEAAQTPLEVMRTDSAAFVELIAARRNRPEAFFPVKHDFIDVCGVPIPVRDKVLPTP